MILSDSAIQDARRDGDIVITPFEPTRLNANSYNVTLGPELVIYDCLILDPKAKNRCHTEEIPEEGYVLQPGSLYLGSTVEWTKTKSYVPMIEGRSSMGRLGLFVHITAGFGDVGFEGNWTLELSCVQRVRIYAGMEIAQLYYHTVEGEVFQPYHGKYQGSKGVVESRAHLD